MALIEQELIIKSDNFVSTLEQCFGAEYGLGIHGIENSECWLKVDGVWQLNKRYVDEIKNNILEEGLNINKNRTLLSTVRFSEIESYLTRGYYEAGGVIIALPKELKAIDEEAIFVGTPAEENVRDRNYEMSVLSDMILPEYGENEVHLNSMFILAKYEKMNDEYVKLTMNQKHISYKNGLLPKEYFNLKKKRITDICSRYGVESIDELFQKIYDITIQNEDLTIEEQVIIETANQYNVIDRKISL